MPSKDLHNAIKAVLALAPVVATDNTVLNTGIIDTQGFESCEFVIATGTLADVDATFAVTLTAGDDAALADGAAPAASELLGTLALASFTFAADNVTKKIGYVGIKRYIKLTITPAANAGNAPLSVVAILGHARHKPS